MSALELNVSMHNAITVGGQNLLRKFAEMGVAARLQTALHPSPTHNYIELTCIYSSHEHTTICSNIIIT